MKKQEKRSSYWKDVRTRFFSHKLAVFGLICIAVMVLLVVFLPMIYDLDPYQSYVEGGFNKPPSASHILGTDQTGRDIFSRLVYGGRVSLTVGLISTLISMLIGVPLGLIAGYFRGAPEAIIMRLIDIFMAFPPLVLILILVSVFRPSVISVTIVLGVLGWTQFARLIHSQAISVREKDYVEAARASGVKSTGVMIRYILPNSFAPCIVAMTFRIAAAIITESSLSFMGLGVPLPTASWGNLMHDAQSISILSMQPWSWLPPGLCLVLAVLSINFFGDGLRDALDPKMKL